MDLTEFSEAWADWIDFIANQGEGKDPYLEAQREEPSEDPIDDLPPVRRRRSDGDYGP